MSGCGLPFGSRRFVLYIKDFFPAAEHIPMYIYLVNSSLLFRNIKTKLAVLPP